jgi:hypothetical protein
MKLLINRDEKVVVTRGYLMAFGGMLLIMAGTGLSGSSMLPSVVRLPLLAIGVGVVIWNFPHLLTPPQPLNQDRPEEQG